MPSRRRSSGPRHYGAIARDALAIFRKDSHVSALADVIGFCISRAS